MAPILKIECPKCGGRLKITPKESPSKVRCPGCQATIKVPPLSALTAESEADEYEDLADETSDSEDDAYEESHSESEWDSSDSAWDEASGDYGEDEYDDEYEPPRRRRRKATSNRNGGKTVAAKTSRDGDEDSSGKMIAIIGGAVVGVVAVGALIFFAMSGDEDTVASNDGDANDNSGNSGQRNDGSGSEAAAETQARSPAEIVEATRQYVREQASVIDAPDRGTWGISAGELRRNWDLSPAALPERDFAAMQELSAKNAGISFGFADTKNKWCLLPRPERGQNSVLVNLETWTGRQIQGQPASMSSAAEVGYVGGGGRSDDATLIGRELRVNRSRLDAREHWVTIHKFDNTILKVIPGAKKMHFLPGDRILLATDGIADSSKMSRKDGYDQAQRRHLLSRAVWFQNLKTDEVPERIEIRNGGHWLLSPARRYLVIVEPDAETAARLNDPEAPHFNGRSSSTQVTVYDTSTGGKVAEAEYSNLTVGFVGGFTDDGTKLALQAGQNVAVLDMTNGSVLKTGTRLDVSDHTEFTIKLPIWIAGDRFLLLDWNLMVDVETGIAFGGFNLPGSTSRDPLALNDWLGGEYVRYSRNGGYWRFPVENLTTNADAITDPAKNLLAARQVTLQINGAEKLSPLDQDMVRECLKVMLDSRCDLKVVDEETAAIPVVEVTYSESQKEGPYSMERWHQDATRQTVNTDRNTWVKDQYVLDVSLSFRCVTSDGRLLAEDKGSGVGIPGGMKFDIPGAVQFRNAAVMKAGEKLALDLPALVPPSPDGTVIPRSWPIEIVKAQPPDYAAMSIEKIDINNSWLNQDLGLPVRLAAMHFSEEQRKQVSQRGIRPYHFVRHNDSPAMLMMAGDEWLLTPISSEVSITKPQLPAARQFALHPNGAEFAASHDKVLALGTVGQPSQVHEVELNPSIVTDMSFSGDGRLLAIGRGQKVGIHVYEVDDLKTVSRLDDATPVATFDEPNVQGFMSFSKNKNLFVTATRDTIIVWDVEKQRGIFEHRVQQPTGLRTVTVRAVALGADGSRLFASVGENVVEFSLETLMETRRFPEPDATALAMSPSGDRLAIARQTDTIAVMNVEGEPSLQIYNMGNSTNGRPQVGWSYDGSMMYGFGSGGLSVWEMNSK